MLRRGFKSEANAIAREIRAELRLGSADPLDPWMLAARLEIPVWPLSDLADVAAGAVRHFAVLDPSAFSAITVFRGSRRAIVHNDAHTPGRRRSNVMHELSHGLLLHPPTPPLDARGLRQVDADREGEADWLAGALLVPEDAAIAVARAGWDDETGADHYGVSVPMMRYRMEHDRRAQPCSAARAGEASSAESALGGCLRERRCDWGHRDRRAPGSRRRLI